MDYKWGNSIITVNKMLDKHSNIVDLFKSHCFNKVKTVNDNSENSILSIKTMVILDKIEYSKKQIKEIIDNHVLYGNPMPTFFALFYTNNIFLLNHMYKLNIDEIILPKTIIDGLYSMAMNDLFEDHYKFNICIDKDNSNPFGDYFIVSLCLNQKMIYQNIVPTLDIKYINNVPSYRQMEFATSYGARHKL